MPGRGALTTAFAILALLAPCTSFMPPATKLSLPQSTPATSGSYIPSLNLAKQDGNTEDEAATSKNPLELASWYAVEAFGKAFGSKRSSDPNSGNTDSIDLTKPPSSLQETLQRIQLDNDRSYFLSGEVDRFIYDPSCTFADPFVSFDGRDRFIDNLQNLGSFITNYSAKMIKYDVNEGGKEIVTKVSIKL